ncbi:MAG: heparinase II/III family protein [Paenibacillaceae bacterium]
MLLPSSGAINSNELLQPLLQEILHEAELARDNPLGILSYSLFCQFELNGDREQYQQVYFARRGRLAACAISALIDDNPQHIELLQETIWDICNEYTWCLPAHLEGSPVPSEQTIDLFAAETAHALAEILILLQARMETSLAHRIRKEIDRRIFQPMCMDSVRFDWETADHNWASVCGGAVGMAAMLLIEDKEQLTGILHRCIGAMESFLGGYGEDGGCAEGIGYWVYGFGYYVYFAEMLEVYSSGQWDLMNQDKVSAIAGYPEAVHLSDGVYANFSDAPERVVLPTGLLSRLSARSGAPMPFPCIVPAFHDDPCYRWAHLSRNLWWTDEACFGAQSKLGLQWLDNLGIVIDRRTVAGMNVAFSAKGGHNGEAHNHNDLGHFILHANGNNLLIDLGHGLYTKEYFREGRYEILNNSSAGHSVPIINGAEQATGEEYRATWLQLCELANGSEYRLDLSHAYPKSAGVHRYIRTYQWTTTASTCQLRLEDRFHFHHSSTHPYLVEERFISQLRPIISDEATVVEWTSGDTKLKLHYDTLQFTAQVQTVQHQDHAGNPITVYITNLFAEYSEQDFLGVLEFTMLS